MFFAHLSSPKLTHPQTWEFGHIQYETCFLPSPLSASRTCYVLKPPGSVSQVPAVPRMHLSSSAPSTDLAVWIQSEGSFCEGAQPTHAADDLDFKYSPLAGKKWAPFLLSWWISFLPKTQRFSPSEQEKVPLRRAMIDHCLSDEEDKWHWDGWNFNTYNFASVVTKSMWFQTKLFYSIALYN